MEDTKPLNEAHGKIDSGTRIVCCESAHEGIKFRRGRADAKEKRNFDEDDEERARAGEILACRPQIKNRQLTDKELRKES
jgi:hypothetical protein